MGFIAFAAFLTALILYAPRAVWRFIGYSTLTFIIMWVALSGVHYASTLPV